LFGVNASEEGLCFSEEAKKKLEALVEGKRVVIKNPIVDKWGRIIAVVYSKEKMVNEEMIKGGFGRYDSEVNSDSDELRNARDLAISGGKGIYGECVQKENIENSECNIKGNQDYGPKIYHLPGCLDYDRTLVDLDLGDKWFCSEKEANKAGFERSKNCPN